MLAEAKMQVSHFQHGRRSHNRVGGVISGRRRRRHHRHHRHHRREDRAVEGIQQAGRELSDTFRRLQRRCKARKLVEAIRRCDAHTVNRLLDRDCRVHCFFRKPGFDCVKICCRFGRGDSAFVTFDICVRSVSNEFFHHRCC